MPKWSHYLDDEFDDTPTPKVEKIRKTSRFQEVESKKDKENERRIVNTPK